MTRFLLALLAALIVAGMVTIAVARAFGRSGSRASVLVSVVASWLAAWVLWTFGGGLAVRSGALVVYDASLFAPLAAVGGIVHYRAAVRGGREPGLAVFVGGQLLWLVVVLARNGVFHF